MLKENYINFYSAIHTWSLVLTDTTVLTPGGATTTSLTLVHVHLTAFPGPAGAALTAEAAHTVGAGGVVEAGVGGTLVKVLCEDV